MSRRPCAGPGWRAIPVLSFREIEMFKSTHLIAALALSGLFLAGCEKPAGPAESAGKEVDKAVQSAGQQIERAGEKIQDAAKDAKK